MISSVPNFSYEWLDGHTFLWLDGELSSLFWILSFLFTHLIWSLHLLLNAQSWLFHAQKITPTLFEYVLWSNVWCLCLIIFFFASLAARSTIYILFHPTALSCPVVAHPYYTIAPPLTKFDSRTWISLAIAFDFYYYIYTRTSFQSNPCFCNIDDTIRRMTAENLSLGLVVPYPPSLPDFITHGLLILHRWIHGRSVVPTPRPFIAIVPSSRTEPRPLVL